MVWSMEGLSPTQQQAVLAVKDIGRKLPMGLPLENLSGLMESTTKESEKSGVCYLDLLTINSVILCKSLSFFGTQ